MGKGGSSGKGEANTEEGREMGKITIKVFEKVTKNHTINRKSLLHTNFMCKYTCVVLMNFSHLG